MLRAYGVDFCSWLLASSVGPNPLCPPRFAESSLLGLSEKHLRVKWREGHNKLEAQSMLS